MTRTFKTIAAIAALICMSTPAFAHGGGHGGGNGGMGNGGMNNGGIGAGKNNDHSTSPVTWNITQNTAGQNTGTQHNSHSMSSTTWNKIDNTVGGHHGRKFKINLVRRQERIKRLQLEVGQLAMKIEQQMALNHVHEVAQLQRQLRRIVHELKNEGATI